MGDKRISMTRADYYHVAKVLEPVLSKAGEKDGKKMVKYADGWDDQRVATVAGADLRNVQTVRRELFGELPTYPGNANHIYHKIDARVADLERRVQELEDQLTKPSSVKTFSDLPKIINGPNRP